MTVTDLLQLRALDPPPHVQAGRKVPAVIRESRSPGSTKRVLTTSGAMAARKPLLQPSAAQPVEHGRGSGHRQETVRKLALQAGEPQALRAKADAPKPCKGNERKELGENRGRRLAAGEASLAGCGPGKLLSPERRRCAVERARGKYGLSERHACRLLGPWRGTQRYPPIHRLDEDDLTRAVVALAAQYGRYGYRRITALLRNAGWSVGKDRVQRIWRREGLKVPQKQRPRRRLWRNDGSCVRLRPEHRNHVWSYDLVSARTHDGRTLRLLTLLDEYRRECLAIRVERRMGSLEVIETLSDVMLWRGIPEHIRSDNGPEFVAQELRQRLSNLGTGTLYIEPGSPWENGYVESLNGKFRDEFLNGEIFYTLREAKVLIEGWRREYNKVRPHSALGYRPPAQSVTVEKPARMCASLAAHHGA